MSHNTSFGFDCTFFFPVANGSSPRLLTLTLNSLVDQQRQTSSVAVASNPDHQMFGRDSIFNARASLHPHKLAQLQDVVVSFSDAGFDEGSFGFTAAIADQFARHRTKIDKRIAATGIVGENGKIERVGRLLDKLTAVLNFSQKVDYFFYPLDCVKGDNAQISQEELKQIRSSSKNPNIILQPVDNISELKHLLEWGEEQEKFPKIQNKLLASCLLVFFLSLVAAGFYFFYQGKTDIPIPQLKHELSATSKTLQIATRYKDIISSEKEWLREIWLEEFPKYEALQTCNGLLQKAVDGKNLDNIKDVLRTCPEKRKDLESYLEEIVYLIGIGNHLELTISQFREDLYSEEQTLKKHQKQLGELTTNFDKFPAKELIEKIDNISSGFATVKPVAGELCDQRLHELKESLGKTKLYVKLQNRCDQIRQGWNGLQASLQDIQRKFRKKTLSQERQVLISKLVATLEQLEHEQSRAEKFVQNQKFCLQKQVSDTDLIKLQRLDEKLDEKIHTVKQMLENVPNASADALAAIRDLLQTELSDAAQREQERTRMTIHDSISRSCREKDMSTFVKKFDMTKITKGKYSLIDSKRIALFTKWMQRDNIMIDKDFYIQNSEVTIGQYQEFLHTLISEKVEQFSPIKEEGQKHDPVKVDYESARAYINWINRGVGSRGFFFSFATPEQWAAAMVHFADAPGMKKQIRSLMRGADEWSVVDCGDKVVTFGVSDTFKLTKYKGAKRCSPKLYQQGFRLVLQEISRKR